MLIQITHISVPSFWPLPKSSRPHCCHRKDLETLRQSYTLELSLRFINTILNRRRSGSSLLGCSQQFVGFQVAQCRQVMDERAEERRAMYWCMMPAEGLGLRILEHFHSHGPWWWGNAGFFGEVQLLGVNLEISKEPQNWGPEMLWAAQLHIFFDHEDKNQQGTILTTKMI